MKLHSYDIFTRLIRTRPLLTASIAYLTGCIMGYALDIPVWIWLICTGLFLVPAFFLRRRTAYLALAIIAAMLPFGALRFTLAWNSVPVVQSKDDVTLTGRIVSMPEYRSDTERTICVLDEITLDGEEQSYKLRLYLRGDTLLLQDVHISSIVSCTAHLWQADDASNPGQFSFQDYLRLNDLSGYATAEIEYAEFIQTDHRLSERTEIFKDRIGDHIERLFPKNADIARAFLIGDRSHLSEYDRENFSKSGVAHLLAISGMHISALAAMVSLILTRLTGRKPAFIVTMVILIAFGCLIGFTPSFLRALMIFALYSGAPLLGRNYDAPTSLGAAMLIYLMIRPVGILESGFALSFTAAAGIIFMASPLRALTHSDLYLSKRPKNGLAAIFTHRLPRWIVSSIIISLAAQIAIYPIVINNFGYQSPWTLIANLLCVPLAMIAYIVSIIGSITCIPFIAAVGDHLFGLLKSCTVLFSSLPFTSRYTAHFPAYLCLIHALYVFFSSDLSRLSIKIRRFMPLLLIPLILINSFAAKATLNGCSIVFFDAGQADCAAIRCEGRFYLIDTGDDYTPAVDFMQKYAYQPEAIFLSHCHDDHAGGLNDILDYAPPKQIYISANWNAYECSEAVNAAMERAKDLGCEILYLSAGDEIRLSDQSFLRVLAPEAGISANSANDDSLILYFECGGVSALFTGDASADIIDAVGTDIDILKVAHHGSRNHTSSAAIEKLTPSAAFIPVGYNNYGHPSDQVISKLEIAGAKVYRGDHCGTVICSIEKQGSINIRCYKDPEDADGLE